MSILASLSVLVSAVFAFLVFRQYVRKRRPAQAFWGIGLALFAIAALAEGVAQASGEWSTLTAKTYYLFGGMLLVGYLGLGTIYLVFGARFAQIATAVMLAVTAVGAVIITTGYVDVRGLNSAIASGQDWEWKQFVPVGARIVAAVTNILGSLFLIGGAIYSAIMVWLKRQDKGRLVANSVIAAGALVLAGGGTLGGLFGLGQEFISLVQAPGVTIMFIGFLLAGRSQPPQVKQSAVKT